MLGVDKRVWRVVPVEGFRFEWEPLCRTKLSAERRPAEEGDERSVADADDGSGGSAHSGNESESEPSELVSPQMLNRVPAQTYPPFADLERRPAEARKRLLAQVAEAALEPAGSEPVRVAALVRGMAGGSHGGGHGGGLIVLCRDGHERHVDRAALRATPELQRLLVDYYEARLRF